MIYLMWQLWLCLFIALLSGALLGWLSRGGCKKKVSAIDDHWSQRFELIEEERDLFAIKAQDSARLTNENNSLLGRLSSMESGANLASDVLNENKSRLDKADLKLSKMTLLLEQRDSDLIVLQDLLSDANHIDEKTERKSLVSDFNNADEGLRIELKSKNEELEGLANDYQEAKESTGTMRAQLEDYEKVNRELLEKEGEIEQALSVAKKLNIANKEKNAETQSQLEITDQKNHELSKDLDRLSEKLAIADEKSADDVQRIEKITDLYDQNIENSRTFKSQIMQSGNDLRTDLKNQKELCESLEQEIQSVKEEAKVNADKVISVQDLLKVKEKKNDEIVAVEQQLQMDLSTAESLSAKNEEKIAEYQKEKERLADKLHVSKEKELVSENELKVMQGLLVAHEKGSQDLLDKESKLEEELVALKAKEIENKDILSKFESELKKLNNELNFNKEKILIDAGEQKIMQGLLAAHEKGNQESQSKESQLEEELSVLKTREIKSKDVISRFESKLEKLNKALNTSQEKGLADASEQKIMQGLLVAYEKGNQDSKDKESLLKEELSVLKVKETESKDVISKFESKLKKLNKALNTSQEKSLTDASELKIIQSLLAAHEESNQDSQSKESLLEEELSVLKAREIKSKDVVSNFESQLKKLNKELQISQEKGLVDADELKIMQALLTVHEKNGQDFLEREVQLQNSLSTLKTKETKKKEKVFQNSSEIKILRDNLQASNKKEQSANDELEMMQALLDAHLKGNQDLIDKEQKLQQALTIAEKTAKIYKDELEKKNKEALQNDQLKTFVKNKDKQTQLLQSTYDEASSDRMASKVIIKNPVDNSKTVEKPTNHYDIEEIDGIGKGFGKRLRKIGIQTPTDLLEKCQDDTRYAKHIAQAMNQNEKTVSIWLNMADLLRIEGVDGKYAELLYLSGIKSSVDLATSDVNKVRFKMKNVVKNQHHAKKTPKKKLISKWIALAKTLIG